MKIRLDKLKSYRVYGRSSKDTITTLGALNNPREGLVVYPFSMDEKFIKKIFEKELLERQYFKDIYVPMETVVGGRIIRNTGRSKYYRDLRKSTNQFNMYHHNLNQVRSKNLVFDAINSFTTFNKVYSSRGRFKVSKMMELFVNYMNKFDFSHHEVNTPLIIIDASDEVKGQFNPNNYFNISSSKEFTPLQAFYAFVKRNIRNSSNSDPNFEILRRSNIVLYSSKTNYFFKLKLDNTFNWNRFNQRLTSMIKSNKSIESLTYNEVSEMEGNSEGIKPNVIGGEMESAKNPSVKTNNKEPKKINNVKVQDDSELTKDEELKIKDVVPEGKEEIASKINNKLLTNLITSFDLDPNTVKDSELIEYLESKIESSLSEVKDFSSQRKIMSQLASNDELKMALIDVQLAKSNGQELKDVIDNRSKLNYDEINKELDLNGKSIIELLDEFEAKKLKIDEIPRDVAFDELKTSTLKDFDRNYNEHQSDQDLSAVLNSFSNDEDLPMKLHSVEREDSSDSFNKKETLRVKFKDVDNKIHTITIDVPTFVEDKFLYLNGSRNAIVKQLVMKPIIKVDKDTSKITTNYNILHITRFGSRIDGNVNIISKVFNTKNKHKLDFNKMGIILGDSRKIAEEHFIPVDVEELSKYLLQIKIDGMTLNFNLNETQEEMEDKISEREILDNYALLNKDRTDKFLLVHRSSGEVYLYNKKDNTFTKEDDNITLYIFNNMPEEIKDIMERTTPSKKLAYSRIRILSRNLPLAIVLAQRGGLTHLLNRYLVEGEDYKIIKTGEPGARSMSKMLWEQIKFEDGTLFISKRKSRFGLLMNGLKEMNTRNYKLEEMDTLEPYLDYLDDYHGSRNIIKGVNYSLDLMIDPITESVLRDLQLPTNIFDALLYANTLIEDTSYSKPNNLENFRIRSNEIVNAYIYKSMANAFKEYKQKHAANVNPNKMSLPKNVIVKNLLEDPLVNNYSTLNPYLEAQELGAVTFRGIGGINMAKAIGKDMRAYDKSFLGVMGLSTPDSDKVGVVRQLAYDPNIVNTRGMIQIDKSDTEELDATNLLTPVELLSPFTNTHDDPQRSQMMSVQSKVFALYKPY